MRDAQSTPRLSQRIAAALGQPNPKPRPQHPAAMANSVAGPVRSDTRIFKHRPLQDFTIVSNSIAQSKLSLAAKGLMLYFLSLPDTWEIVMPNVQKAAGIGRTALRTIFKELQESGHMRFVPTHWENGKMIGNRWFVYADPMENPSLEVGGRPVRNQPLFIKKEDKETEKEKKKSEPERVSVPSLRSETPTEPFPINDSNPQNDSGAPQAKKVIKSVLRKWDRPAIPPKTRYAPSKEDFDAYVSENCPTIEHLGKGDFEFEKMEANNWHRWNKRTQQWESINWWKKYLDGLEARIETDRTKC